jgi:hypothetical protein
MRHPARFVALNEFSRLFDEVYFRFPIYGRHQLIPVWIYHMDDYAD